MIPCQPMRVEYPCPGGTKCAKCESPASVGEIGLSGTAHYCLEHCTGGGHAGRVAELELKIKKLEDENRRYSELVYELMQDMSKY